LGFIKKTAVHEKDIGNAEKTHKKREQISPFSLQ